jgi:hypothetical protein
VRVRRQLDSNIATWFLNSVTNPSTTIVFFDPTRAVNSAVYRITNLSVINVTVKTADGTEIPPAASLETGVFQSVDVSSTRIDIALAQKVKREFIVQGTYQILCCGEPVSKSS